MCVCLSAILICILRKINRTLLHKVVNLIEIRGASVAIATSFSMHVYWISEWEQFSLYSFILDERTNTFQAKKNEHRTYNFRIQFYLCSQWNCFWLANTRTWCSIFFLGCNFLFLFRSVDGKKVFSEHYPIHHFWKPVR